MVNYETAKKLRDARFPQVMKLEGRYYNGEGQLGHTTFKYNGPNLDAVDKNSAFIPTLSELIEACGGGFGGLFPPNSPTIGDAAKGWVAVKTIGWISPIDQEADPTLESEWSNWICFSGSTPSEAVANLWLELNRR